MVPMDNGLKSNFLWSIGCSVATYLQKIQNVQGLVISAIANFAIVDIG